MATPNPNPATNAPTPDRLLRVKGVEELTTLSKSAIYRMARAGDFPHPVAVTQRLSAWRESDVLAWIASRPAHAA